MTTYQRVSIAIGAIAVAVCLCKLANHWLKPLIFPAEMVQQTQAIKHAAALIEHIEHGTNSTTVCYSIASFNELPASDRSFYETTEAARTAGHGPRCITTHNAAAATLTPGAKLDVFFTLANGGKIVIARIAAGNNPL